MAGLELCNVVKRFGAVTVVQQLDLLVHAGEFMVLLGESGCGKSTTLRMIAGLESVTGGRILIGGRDVTHAAPMDRDIAMVFQNYALYPHMNVAQNMSFALRLSGRAKAEITDKVMAAAHILGIEPLLARKPRELSGGQRQRVAIGRAIVREPRVFLFDEPLSNLDAKLRGHMRAELALLHERLGKTTVYVTHDQVEAMTLASRIVIFDQGRVQQIGTPVQVFTRPASVFVAGFIGTPGMNLLPARYSQEQGQGWLRGAGFAWQAPHWLLAKPPGPQQALTLGLRPQALHPDDSADPAAGNSLSLQVDVVEYLGTESQVVGRMNSPSDSPSGQRVAAMLPGNAQSLLRQRISLGFDPEQMHVFDTDSGRSLRP